MALSQNHRVRFPTVLFCLKIAMQLLTSDFENSSSLQLVCVYMVDGRFQKHNSAKYGSID